MIISVILLDYYCVIQEKMCKFASKMLIYKNYESKREICYFH
jgi:hypothetical protein